MDTSLIVNFAVAMPAIVNPIGKVPTSPVAEELSAENATEPGAYSAGAGPGAAETETTPGGGTDGSRSGGGGAPGSSP